jgi:glycine cleavage system H protein
MKTTWKNTWGKELNFPEDVLYSPELLWVSTEPENRLRLGISDLGVKAVKTLLYIRIKSRAGNQVKKGDLIGMVETSKMVWQIISPVSGVVVAVNGELLQGNPYALQHDPYGEGWLLQLERTSETEGELPQLLRGGEAETKKWIAERVQAIIPLQLAS